MQRLGLLFCFIICVIQSVTTQIDPRGARPVEHGTRSEKCASEKEWPFCTTDEWGPKCPSGCRIEGLMNKYDHSLLKRIEKIRSLLDENTIKQRSTDAATKQTYDYLKDKLITDAGQDTNYYDLAQSLRQRITDMKIKIDRQLRILAALKDRVKDQVVEMQRLEVDVDIKLRSCKGSCQGYAEFQVDHEDYVVLDKQINQLDSQSAQSIDSVKTLYVMKSRPLKDQIVDSIYKSGDTTGALAAQRREDVFTDVPMVQLLLGEEGSSSSPATISKDQGTSYSSPTFSSSSTSSSSSSSSSSSTPSGSITELGGGSHLFGTGGGIQGLGGSATTHMSTQTISCTKSTRRTVVHTKDGPVERVEDVYEGGPDCQALGDSTKGGMGAFFPTLTHTGGAKGSILGNTKTGFGDPFAAEGLDLGGFMTDKADDDVPDFHARSVKSSRVERQADYVGKVCLRLKQQNQDGRHPRRKKYKRQQCRAREDVPLCSDDDWVSKCPSGCRLQGLISQMESDVERKLRMVCETAKTYEDMAEKSMKAMTHIYNYNRRIIINSYTSELKFVEQAERLAGNLTSLQKRSFRLSQELDELRRNAQKQLEDLYRTEVDVDRKLRACSGSCRSALPFSVDHQSHQVLRTDMKQMDKTLNQKMKAGTPPRVIPHIKLQPVDSDLTPSSEYKTIPTVRRELLTQFEDIGQNEVVLEELLVEAADVEALDPVELE